MVNRAFTSITRQQYRQLNSDFNYINMFAWLIIIAEVFNILLKINNY